MDQTSLGELRVLTRELQTLSKRLHWRQQTEERSEELIQAIEVILQEEEANRHGIDPNRLVPHSLDTQLYFGHSGEHVVVLTPTDDFLIGGLYLNDTLVSLGKSPCRGAGVLPYGAIDSQTFTHPLEMRGKVARASTSVRFTAWVRYDPLATLSRDDCTFQVSLLGSRILPIID